MDRADRDRLLAELRTMSHWEALKELLMQRYTQVPIASPNWAVQRAIQDGRLELSLEIIRAVDHAHERVTAPPVGSEPTSEERARQFFLRRQNARPATPQ